MRTKKRKDRTAANGDWTGSSWHDEILANAFELWIGASRLMATVQSGPPHSAPPRNRPPARKKC